MPTTASPYDSPRSTRSRTLASDLEFDLAAAFAFAPLQTTTVAPAASVG